MNFFDYIKNEAFFKPLTLKYKRIYYDCIQILIEKTKELPVLYESDAKDSITVYLKNTGLDEKIYQVMLASKKRGAMNCSHREYFLYFANVAGYFQEG